MSDALFKLTIAVAHLMPGREAAPHAALEWQHARHEWLGALDELGLTEGDARDLAHRVRTYAPAGGAS